MATKVQIPMSKGALAAAKTVAEAAGPEPTKRGDVRLTHKVRKAVVLSAVQELTKAERAKLNGLDNESIHRFIAGVLDHAKCLLAGATGYLTTIIEKGYVDKHAPSVVGPAFVRKAIERIDAPPAEPKPAKKPTKKAASKKSAPKRNRPTRAKKEEAVTA